MVPEIEIGVGIDGDQPEDEINADEANVVNNAAAENNDHDIEEGDNAL